MKKLKFLLIILTLVFIYSCKNENKEKEVVKEVEVEKTVEDTKATKTIKIALNPKSESNVSGSVKFIEENGTVKMIAYLKGLDEGEHAIHIHEKADCSSVDGKSTGGHWNPTAQPHGKWGDETGYHKGDIGNFNVDENGKGEVEFSTDQWCIGCGDDTKDILGKAVIVHQGIDDFTSQPSGAAGKRVSCAGIIE